MFYCPKGRFSQKRHFADGRRTCHAAGLSCTADCRKVVVACSSSDNDGNADTDTIRYDTYIVSCIGTDTNTITVLLPVQVLIPMQNLLCGLRVAFEF